MSIIKVIKKLPPGYVDDVQALTVDEIKSRIIQVEKDLERIDTEREDDDKLQGAKELAKELAAPYRDATNAAKAKIKYLLHTMREKEIVAASVPGETTALPPRPAP